MGEDELSLPEYSGICWGKSKWSNTGSYRWNNRNERKIELELQRSQMLLDASGDIKIKMNPDYN